MTDTVQSASRSLAVLEAQEQRSKTTINELRKAIAELDHKREEVWQAAEEDGARHTRILLAEIELGMEEAKDTLVSGLTRDLKLVSRDVSHGL